jgi:predicted TPR repeat methyltransferase
MDEAGPLFVSSGDLIADRRYHAAIDLAARGDPDAAADVLAQTVAIAPHFTTAWFALGEFRARLGDRDGAIEAFQRASSLDPDDRLGAGLNLARLGEGTPTPPMARAYVQRLFDQYAGRFDGALVEGLHYRGPDVLLRAVETASRTAGRAMRFDAMLDLGCGTGLIGEVFRPFVRELTGVDLSPAMIARAAAKSVYHRLEAADLADFLQGEVEGRRQYDLITAGDVFVYVNDLPPVLALVAKVLAPGGFLAFTLETHPGPDVILQPTLRYAYGAAGLRGMLAEAALSPDIFAEVSVRTEKGVAVPGLVVVAHPAPTVRNP